jgi:hypothetical protein
MQLTAGAAGRATLAGQCLSAVPGKERKKERKKKKREGEGTTTTKTKALNFAVTASNTNIQHVHQILGYCA